MREFLHGPRQSGRTTNFINNLPKQSDEDGTYYIVAANMNLAYFLTSRIKQDRNDITRVRPVSLESLHTLLGVDPFNVFFEHTAYEFSTAKQYQTICAIEDGRNLTWNE